MVMVKATKSGQEYFLLIDILVKIGVAIYVGINQEVWRT